MNGYHLFALDMDGTLLMSDKRIHPETVRDIACAAGRGVHIVYSSGRGAVELTPYARQLPGIRWAICSSGAEVYDFQEKRFVFRSGIAIDLIRDVIRAVGEEDCMVHFLNELCSFVREDKITHMEDYHMGLYKPLYDQVATAVPCMLEEAEKHEFIAKMNLFFRTPEDRETAFLKIRHLPLTFVKGEDSNLEINAAGVSKAMGLEKLAAHLGIPMEETVGIGDGENDRALLEAAGCAVAMGNADPGIRAICDLVTDDNDHNGVGKAIRRLIGA